MRTLAAKALGSVAALALLVTEGAADTVQLKDGRVIECDVLRDVPGMPLLVQCEIEGAAKQYTIARDRVAAVNRADELPTVGSENIKASNNPAAARRAEVTDATATSTESSLRPTKILDCRELRPLIAHTLPQRGKKNRPEVVVLRLEGAFARPQILEVGDTISAGVLKAMLDVAMDRDPDAIVLAIDSPGGLASEMDLVIDEILRAQTAPRNQRVVAWVELGASAAALTALSCREIVMHPTGRIGSATAVLATGEAAPPPQDAMDQKVEAMRQARRRQVAAITGRPLALQEAMEFPDRKLWAHPLLGFSPVPVEGDEWEALDDSATQPMATDADTMVRHGIAKGIAGDVNGVVELLGLGENTQVVEIDLREPRFQDMIRDAKNFALEGNRRLDRFGKRLGKTLNDLVVAKRRAWLLQQGDGYSDHELRQLLGMIRRVKVPGLDAQADEFLKTTFIGGSESHRRGLASADELLERAARTIDLKATSVNIGGICRDLDLAHEFLFGLLP